MSKKSKKQRPKRQFDVRMIKDFLEALHLELRVRELENANPGILNEELQEQMARFFRKYHYVGFLTSTELIDDVGDPEAMDKVAARIYEMQLAVVQPAIAALDTLAPHFEGAFRALAQPDVVVINRLLMSVALAEDEQDDGEQAE